MSPMSQTLKDTNPFLFIMLTVNLWDEEFRHTLKNDGMDTASYKILPRKIQYNRDNFNWNGITLFTNRDLDKVDYVNSTTKVAWMVEARSILPQTYSRLVELEDKFDYILTYYEDLLQRNPKKYIKYVTGSTRIMEPDRKIYEKTKLCSLLTSITTITPAHKFRHELANFIKQNNVNITVFGKYYVPFETKLDAHKDFMFSIVVMNSCEKNYFTEYLIDCFMCGTIPIFYGCPNINEYFNTDGILHFTKFEEIVEILPRLSADLYVSKMDAIKDNFERARKYVSTDDMVCDILRSLPNSQ
jgi:hypothetical protein